MTVLTKASDMGKKPDLMNTPLVVDGRYDPEVVGLRKGPRTHVWVYRSQCSLLMVCLTLCTAVMLLVGAVLGLIYYGEQRQAPRYKGYCAIPIEVPRDVRLQKQAAMMASRMPLRWSAEPEVTVFSTVDEAATGAAVSNLLERFDIDDNVERISVYNSGHNVEFIHDFNANTTGIVDTSRCFTMELDPDVVLNPSVFVFSIERGAAFDLVRVRSHLRALLPARGGSALVAEKCIDKPTYKLQRGDNIRKRSLDEPAHEYMHFAGKHVQEIAIDNLEELVRYENTLPA